MRRGMIAILGIGLTFFNKLRVDVDVVIDPVARLGDRWFLGKIFEYEVEGAYFGVPLSNFAGWMLTATLIVAAYQRIDKAAGDERATALVRP